MQQDQKHHIHHTLHNKKTRNSASTNDHAFTFIIIAFTYLNKSLYYDMLPQIVPRFAVLIPLQQDMPSI